MCDNGLLLGVRDDS